MSEIQFKMPIPEVGDLVWWFSTANKHEEPCGAYVTHVGERTLALSVIARDVPTFHCVDGVHHIEDPRLLKVKDPPAGAWAPKGYGKVVVDRMPDRQKSKPKLEEALA